MRKIFLFVLAGLFIFSLKTCNESIKDVLIDEYDSFITNISKQALTAAEDLQGERIQDIDEYIGSYQAEYERFNGEEYLFGGTALKCKNGNNLNVTYTLTVTEGSAELYWLDAGEMHSIASQTTEDTYELTISAGDNYIVLKGDNFSGTLKMTVSER